MKLAAKLRTRVRAWILIESHTYNGQAGQICHQRNRLTEKGHFVVDGELTYLVKPVKVIFATEVDAV